MSDIGMSVHMLWIFSRDKVVREKIIIFTDLDGTLLDLNNYSYRGAEETLNLIREQNIPLVFCSSKTRVEQEYYQRELNINHPFIVENGAAIFIKKNYFSFDFEHQNANANYHIIEIGMPYNLIRGKLARIKNENKFDFAGYSDMTVAEVSELTGLTETAAKRAMAREYSETIRFIDSKEGLQRFELALQKEDLHCSHGGRFLTVTARSNDKGKAVEILKNLYLKNFNSIKTIGIGDALNDLPLLSVVDIPILLQRKKENWPEINLSQLRKISGSGPEVWSRIISKLLHSEAWVV